MRGRRVFVNWGTDTGACNEVQWFSSVTSGAVYYTCIYVRNILLEFISRFAMNESGVTFQWYNDSSSKAVGNAG